MPRQTVCLTREGPQHLQAASRQSLELVVQHYLPRNATEVVGVGGSVSLDLHMHAPSLTHTHTLHNPKTQHSSDEHGLRVL